MAKVETKQRTIRRPVMPPGQAGARIVTLELELKALKKSRHDYGPSIAAANARIDQLEARLREMEMKPCHVGGKAPAGTPGGKPMQWRIVALRSFTWTGFSTML